MAEHHFAKLMHFIALLWLSVHGCSSMSMAKSHSQTLVTACQQLPVLNSQQIKSYCVSLTFGMCAAALSDQARLINTMASRGANINAPDIHGKTPLHYAIAAGSAKERLGDFDGMARTCVTVKVLLRQGANLMVKDGHGKYPLALASTQMSGVVEDEVYLIETCSEDLQDDFC